jgi:hypothetical protein
MTQNPPVTADTAETGDDEGVIVEVVEVDICGEQEADEACSKTGPEGGTAG